MSAALAAADELSRADILAADDPLAFTHPLLRAAVYGSLPRQRRAETHGRAAAVLLAAHAPSEQVAAHLLETPPAGDPEVVAALRAAARTAMAHGVPSSAVSYLERALREPPPAALLADVLAEIGRAEANIAPHRAIEYLERASDLTPEPTARAALAIVLGRALHDAGRPADACAALERGAAELGEVGGELRHELEAWYLTSAVLLPDRARDAHRRTEAILARATQPSTPAERGLMSKTLIMRVYRGEPCEPLGRLAWDLYANGRLLEEGGIVSQAVGHVIGTLSYCDRYADAETVCARSEAKTRQAGWVTWFAASLQFRARLRVWTGPIPSVIADAATAVEIFSSGMQMYLPASAYCLVRGLLEHDQPDEAERVLARVEREVPSAGIFAAWQHEGHGRLAAHRGDPGRALEEFLACGEMVSGILVTNPAMFHWRSEAGLAALRLGQNERARELIEDELERAERFGARVEHAHTLVELGGAIRRDGRPSEARDTLREGLRLAEAAGALAAARRGREELQRAGGRAPARTDTVGELTPSELRVAELAAAGRTNREIANELFVTVKAVEWHLGNAYRKLDIRGRGDLARMLA